MYRNAPIPLSSGKAQSSGDLTKILGHEPGIRRTTRVGKMPKERAEGQPQAEAREISLDEVIRRRIRGGIEELEATLNVLRRERSQSYRLHKYADIAFVARSAELVHALSIPILRMLETCPEEGPDS
jgi:hypothetical protein